MLPILSIFLSCILKKYEIAGCDSSSEFTCLDQTCIPKALECDNIPDCADGSDEMKSHCNPSMSRKLSSLQLHELMCLSIIFSGPQEDPCLTVAKPCDIYSGGFTHSGAQHRGCLDPAKVGLAVDSYTFGSPSASHASHARFCHVRHADGKVSWAKCGGGCYDSRNGLIECPDYAADVSDLDYNDYNPCSEVLFLYNQAT